MNENTVTLTLSGRIDSGNAGDIEKKLLSQLEGREVSAVIVDAQTLEYISSAGLRVILHLKKAYKDFRIINVCSDVYEILEMTGFTEMMDVEKAYRTVSVEGCEVIGEGFNGKVYRIDKDNVVKTYKNADALAEIQHEREVAKLALILGIPTAISYDVVRVGDSYGSVFELLDATSFAKILAKEPERMDFCVEEYVKMLRKLHSTHVPEGKLPHIKDNILQAIERMKGRLPDEAGDKLLSMAKAIPDCDTMIHGDFHTKNIVWAGNETLIIDMDTLSVGHPIFEFLFMYNGYIGYYEHNPSAILDFQGFDFETSKEFWRKTLCAYFGTENENSIRKYEDKMRCLAYSRLIDWRARHFGDGTQENREILADLAEKLTTLLSRVDSLYFDTDEKAQDNELTVEARNDNLDNVLSFVNARLSEVDCSKKTLMQMDIAVEEIFVNIANYAYTPKKGYATVKVEVTDDPVTVIITFTDSGVPYDPLRKDDPDISLPADEREVGGLGIFMSKKMMDDISYEYRDGHNILTMKKKM